MEINLLTSLSSPFVGEKKEHQKRIASKRISEPCHFPAGNMRGEGKGPPAMFVIGVLLLQQKPVRGGGKQWAFESRGRKGGLFGTGGQRKNPLVWCLGIGCFKHVHSSGGKSPRYRLPWGSLIQALGVLFKAGVEKEGGGINHVLSCPKRKGEKRNWLFSMRLWGGFP